MKYLIGLLVCIGLTRTADGQTPAAQSPDALITVDVAHPGAAISKDLYGIFFEDINHAVEGGLYGELLKNRDFESNRPPEDMTRDGDFLHTLRGWTDYYRSPPPIDGWYTVRSGEADGDLREVDTDPLHVSNPISLQMTVRRLGLSGSPGGVHSAGAPRFGVANTGYWGVPIAKGASYHFRLYAHKDETFKGALCVTLEDSLGNVYARQIITGIQQVWKPFSCTLTATGSVANGRLVICPLSTGRVWIDAVSFFSEHTYLDRTGGLRKDIADMIAAVHPGFLRFPGGCIVEGADLNNRIKWYNTVGDVTARPGHWDLWGYHTTDGVGFQDYLQFCEDLHAAPMYVFPVGMSCQFRKCEYVPVDSLQPYIDEVLHALDYAMSPVTSTWGALRAKNGHPAPFSIKYVEIGNENYGPLYQERYHYFYDAIKTRYPGIMPITCTDPSMRASFRLQDLPGIDSSKVEMIDEHFYESPDFFYKNVTRYDRYDRKGPKVYVGEFAVKKWDNTGLGNLEGALAEAAFYTGLERNADVVRLASLAPTLVNDNDRTWNPDLICFNNRQVYGIPSYHAIKLFKNNLADRVLPVSLEEPAAPGAARPGPALSGAGSAGPASPGAARADPASASGTIAAPGLPPSAGQGMLGLLNPAAHCRYKDVSVTVEGRTFSGRDLFTESAWATAKDSEFVVGPSGHVTLPFNEAVLSFGRAHDWKDYTLSLSAYADRIDDLEGFTVLFWRPGQDRHWKWDIGRWRRMYWLEWYDHGYESYFGEARGNIDEHRWYQVSIRVSADSVFTYLDGRPIHAVPKPVMTTPGVYVSAGEKAGKEIIIKVVNATEAPRPARIHLDHAGHLSSIGQAIVLTSDSRLDENSFAHPDRVSPHTVVLRNVSSRFRYVFAAHSITVLKFKRT